MTSVAVPSAVRCLRPAWARAAPVSVWVTGSNALSSLVVKRPRVVAASHARRPYRKAPRHWGSGPVSPPVAALKLLPALRPATLRLGQPGDRSTYRISKVISCWIQTLARRSLSAGVNSKRAADLVQQHGRPAAPVTRPPCPGNRLLASFFLSYRLVTRETRIRDRSPSWPSTVRHLYRASVILLELGLRTCSTTPYSPSVTSCSARC